MFNLLNNALGVMYDYFDYIDGYLNGIRIDTITDLEVFDDTVQTPLGLDIPLQVKFGPAVLSESGFISVDEFGTIKNISDNVLEYNTFTELSVGRSGTPQTSYIYMYAEYNGFILQKTNVVSLFNSEEYKLVTLTSAFEVQPDDEVKMFIVRDSQGANDGGLRPFTPALPGVGIAHSASLTLEYTRVVSP
jgi:hypothetical protein